MPRKCKTYYQRKKEAQQGTPQAARERRADRMRATPLDVAVQKLRSSGRWQRLRKSILIEGPLCRDPFGNHRDAGRVVLAVEVHHIKQARDHLELFFAEDNLAPLCTECHGRISGMERGHVHTAHLFDPRQEQEEERAGEAD